MQYKENAQNENFTKDNLDKYLNDLGKEYRKLVGKRMPAEIVLVGGAAVLANYDFRMQTQDVDAMIHAATAIRDAAHNVAHKYNLPYDWLNTDFVKTSSYSSKLNQYSKYYKQFSNVLTVRTVSAEYLIAMKLCTEREYKRDRSDIIGILNEHEKAGNPISLDQIKIAVTNLYGKWDYIPETSRQFIEDAYKSEDLDHEYQNVSRSEHQTKQLLENFIEKYPGTLNENNISEITLTLRKNTEKAEDNDKSGWLDRQIKEKMQLAKEQSTYHNKTHHSQDMER